MLADTTARTPGLGALAPGVLARGTFLARVVDFIADNLPRWRDSPDRPPVQSERELTAQLGAWLNSAARRGGLDVVQFRTEVPDPVQRGRSLDIAVQPCGPPLLVEGRRYTLFDILLPIECKRLPTPPDPGRDDREYVASDSAAAGGIQRFKLGAHGAAHAHGLMIAYIQDDRPPAHWQRVINHWMLEIGATDPFWAGEQLTADPDPDAPGPVQRLRSTHRRHPRDTPIELTHLWIAISAPR